MNAATEAFTPAPIDTPDAIRTRIADFCRWFGLEAPDLKVEHGDIVADEAFWAWMRASGASWDWIVCGDAHGMAARFRDASLQEAQFRALLDQFEPGEVAELNAALADCRRQQAEIWLRTLDTLSARLSRQQPALGVAVMGHPLDAMDEALKQAAAAA